MAAQPGIYLGNGLGCRRNGAGVAPSAHSLRARSPNYGEALRRPTGRVHWAGAETATVWCGYMEGAVRSGEAGPAEEVLDAEGWRL